MKHHFLSCVTGDTRVVCSFSGTEDKSINETELLPFKVSKIKSVEWCFNSNATIELLNGNDHMLYMSGNGRIEKFEADVGSLKIRPIHEIEEHDTYSIIVTVVKG